jgi:hypothetical protein
MMPYGFLPPAPVQVPDREVIFSPYGSRGGESAGMRLYEGLVTAPPAVAEHPPIVVFKDHSAFTVTRHWTTGETFYFTTTQGETLEAPLVEVERIYGANRHVEGVENNRARNSASASTYLGTFDSTH